MVSSSHLFPIGTGGLLLRVTPKYSLTFCVSRCKISVRIHRKEVSPVPSDKKRVNLTIPDDLYQRIQDYKQRQGITNDASACLQLIVQQLNGLEQSQAMLRLLNNCSIDQLVEMSRDGLTEIKSTLSQEK